MTNLIKELSIILPCRNEDKLIIDTVYSFIANKTSIPYEIIIVDDGSVDRCCDSLRTDLRHTCDYYNIKIVTNQEPLGACKARNIGVSNSSSKSEYICFCDAHTFFEQNWLDRIVECLLNNNDTIVTAGIADSTNPNMCGYGATLNINEIKNHFHPLWLPKPNIITEVPLSLGGCMAMSKTLFNNIGGFDEGFQIFGNEDVELSIRTWLFGYRILATPLTKINHVFRKKNPYPISQNNIDYNNLRMALSHFNKQRIEKILKQIKLRNNIEYVEQLMSNISKSDVFEQRLKYLQIRKYDDNFFFNKFNINF